MSTTYWRLVTALILTCVTSAGINAQEIAASKQQRDALKHVLQVIKDQPYYALDWSELKLTATDEQSANYLKDALSDFGRSAAGIMEQSLWVDAAAGHPEAVLAFYDGNVTTHPEDITRLNTACWARAAHGLDLKNVLAVCNAAVAADSKSYTLVFRGIAELQLELFSEALHDFNKALGDKKFQTHPMLANAAFGRGIARLRLGDADGRKDIEAAIRANNRVESSFAAIGVTR